MTPRPHSDSPVVVRTRRSSHAARCLAGLAVLALAGGCAGGPESRESVSSTQFQDVVVPSGMRLIDDVHQSYSTVAASWRLGHFVYSGLLRSDEAASYVRQRMPQHNWQLAAEEAVDANTVKLRFVRAQYVAEYKFIHLEGRLQMVVDYSTDYPSR